MRANGTGVSARAAGRGAPPLFGYEIAPQLFVHLSNCGEFRDIDECQRVKGRRPAFDAILVSRGGLVLEETLPDGHVAVDVNAGEVHVVPPYASHRITALLTPETVVLWVRFSFFGLPHVRVLPTPADALAVLYRSGEARPNVWMIPRHLALGADLALSVDLHRTILELKTFWGSPTLPGHEACGAWLALLQHAGFKYLLRGPSARTGITSRQLRVAHACQAIRPYHDATRTFAMAAQAAGVTPAYLSRCFRQVTGLRFEEFQLQTRVHYAMELMGAQPAGTIKDICASAGFSSPAYFGRVFHRLTGLTPRQYVRQAALAADSRTAQPLPPKVTTGRKGLRVRRAGRAKSA